MKLKIIEFFLKLYFNYEEHSEVEVEDIIEDRMLSTIFAYLRLNKEEEGDKKPVKDSKVIASLIKIHDMLQGLIKSQEIEEFEMEDYKIYQKYFKKFSQLGANINLQDDKEKAEKMASIVKLSLLVLILFLKNPTEYNDILADLIQITKFDQDWQKVYTDLFIELLHKGNSKNILLEH